MRIKASHLRRVDTHISEGGAILLHMRPEIVYTRAQFIKILGMNHKDRDEIMTIRPIFMIMLVFCLMAAALPVSAQTLNCDTIPELQGNRRDRSIRDNQECILWPQSTDDIKIYYPVPNGSDEDVTEDDLQAIKSAVENSMQTYGDNGFLSVQEQPPVYLWASRGGSAIELATAVARVYNNTSPCVVNIYWSAVKSGELTDNQLKQSLAHELFHCVQYAQLDMYAGRTGITAWWSEGSADWASGIVYPRMNGEQEWSPSFEQDKSLIDQCDPGTNSACGERYSVYATSLFFQDMANQKGNGAVFDLLKHIAVRSRTPQMQAIAATPDIDQVFEKFAQDYIDKKISDPGGGYMAQPDVIISDSFDIDEGRDVTVQGTPLVVSAYKLNFAKGKIYQLAGLEPQGRFLLSNRTDDEPWINGGDAAPVTIDASCTAKTVTIAVSSAKDASESQSFTLHATVTDADVVCACQCARPVPACVIGNWRSDEAPQLDLFVNNLMNVTKTGKNTAAFENGQVTVDSADLKLNVKRGGAFSHSTAIDYHGSGRMSGQQISMKGGIRGKSQGTACLTQERELCMQYQSVSPPVQMQITAMGMTIPFTSAGGTYSGSITMPYTCSATTLTLKQTLQGEGPVPTQEMQIKYHR